MKSVIKTAAMAVLFIAASNGFANGPDRLKVAVEVSKPEVYKEFGLLSKDPVFNRKGDKVMLNMLNLDQKAVIIRVLDAERRVVFQEKVTGEAVIQKAFNFNDAFKGDYTIEILDNKKKFTEKVIVK